MLSSPENFDYPDLCKSPKQTGASTIEIIVFVQDIDHHLLRHWALMTLSKQDHSKSRAETGNGIPIDEYLE
jgi:hypothetical protein